MPLCKIDINDYADGMRVILTRHYQTLSNAKGRILGWGNSPPCPESKADIEFIYKQLRANGVRFDAVYASDLARARQTAVTYAELLGIADVIVKPELKEVNYGELQTRKKSWVYQNYEQHKANPAFVYPGGESFQQMQQRSTTFLTSLALAHPDLTVLIVSHAGVIRGIISRFLGLDYSQSLKHTIPFRYIGDFLFNEGSCVNYNELGDVSGFVQASVIGIPFSSSRSAS